MTIEEAFKQILETDDEFLTLCPGGVYPDLLPQRQATWPASTYRHTTRDDVPCVSGEPAGVFRDTFELTVEGPERIEVGQVRDRVREIFSGTACRGTVGSIKVRGGLVNTADASSGPPSDGSERKDREGRLDITIIWKR